MSKVSKVSFLSSKIYKTNFVRASVTERGSLFAHFYVCRHVPCNLYRRQMPEKLLEKNITN